MFVSGVQSGFRLDSRYKHAGMTDSDRTIKRLTQQAAGIRPKEIENRGLRTGILYPPSSIPNVCSQRTVQLTAFRQMIGDRADLFGEQRRFEFRIDDTMIRISDDVHWVQVLPHF